MRLLTRSDFDGLVCGVLLVEKGIVDEFSFVHPKDIQDGKVEVTGNDVLANVPFVPGCGLWFDHHASEDLRVDPAVPYDGRNAVAPSAAQVIWDYYGGQESFRPDLLPLLHAVNKSDSGDLLPEEILHPSGWILLSFIMDPRTGLGRFTDYHISNYQLMEKLIGLCRTKTAAEVLQDPDVKERVDRYYEQHDKHKQMLLENSRTLDNVILTDLRDCDPIYAGNRFMVYALYPEQNVEVRVMWGKQKQNVAITCGHSIVNRSCTADIGKLMLAQGGGGHPRVGTCQVPVDEADSTVNELVEALREPA